MSKEWVPGEQAHRCYPLPFAGYMGRLACKVLLWGEMRAQCIFWTTNERVGANGKWQVAQQWNSEVAGA